MHDPVCHEVFRHINSDESRHIAVDFQVLELIGAGPLHKLLDRELGNLKPQVVLGLIVVFVPLINKMRDNIVAMGLPEEKLYNAVKRFNDDRQSAASTPSASRRTTCSAHAGGDGHRPHARSTTSYSPTRW